MIDHDRCPDCKRFWTQCPCCQVSFCQECGQEESEAVFEDEEEWGPNEFNQGDFV